MNEIKKTPLYSVYQKQAKLIDFNGWLLPVQFSSIKKEHEAVRNAAGMFDVSHMGELLVEGPDAMEELQKITTNDMRKLRPGKAQYTLMCTEDGGTVDDFVIYQIAEGRYVLVVNAGNTQKDESWLRSHLQGDMQITNRSQEIAQIAVQGPKAEMIVQRLTDYHLSQIGFFQFADSVTLANITALVSRTGYTGEDGLEIYVASDQAPTLWYELLHVGEKEGLLPCGLGARDTLRLEACFPLYGQELSPTITPVEAGLGFAIKKDKGGFIGREVLIQQLTEGAPRKIVGIEMVDRGIPRTQYTVYQGEKPIGFVTSGTQSPTYRKSLGLALIDSQYAQWGDSIQVDIRGQRKAAKIVRTPFYQR